MADHHLAQVPISVVRRTPDMVARIAGHDELLKDPKSAK